MAIVTERWDGMRWTLWRRARDWAAGRDKLRERFEDVLASGVEAYVQRRVDPMPQWSASSLAEVLWLNRAGVPVSRKATEARRARYSGVSAL